MLAAAISVASFGFFWARSTVTQKVPIDQKTLIHLSHQLNRKVTSLQKNYETQLQKLAPFALQSTSEFDTQILSERYIGIQKITLIQRQKSGKNRGYFGITKSQASDFPPVHNDHFLEVDLNAFLSSEENTKWINPFSLNPYFLYYQSEKKIIVFMINRKVVLSRIDQWLSDNYLASSQSLIQSKHPHQLVGPTGTIFEANAGTVPPDTVYPISSPIGRWELRSWDRWTSSTHFNNTILVSAIAITIALLILGITLYYFLQRSFKVASQRVSFANQISHEIRTPLTNIMLNLDLAIDQCQPDSPTAKRIKIADEEIHRLQRLLDNVLTFSETKKHKKRLSLTEFSLKEEITKALHSIQPNLKRNQITPQQIHPQNLIARADADAFSQIINNLFSNILKYAGEGSELIIESEFKAPKVILRFIDSGPGIDTKKRHKIFKPFHRLNHKIDEGVSGSGLGLAISRTLARSMGGDLSCIDRPDRKPGACFELTLPGSIAQSPTNEENQHS